MRWRMYSWYCCLRDGRDGRLRCCWSCRAVGRLLEGRSEGHEVATGQGVGGGSGGGQRQGSVLGSLVVVPPALGLSAGKGRCHLNYARAFGTTTFLAQLLVRAEDGSLQVTSFGDGDDLRVILTLS